MTNKIKLLLWSFLTILFVWLSSTYALEVFNRSSYEMDCISTKWWKNLLRLNWWGDASRDYFDCIPKNQDIESAYFKNYSRKSTVNFFEDKKYTFMDWWWYNWDYYFWSYKSLYISPSSSSEYRLWKDENGIYVFSVLEKEDKKMYKRMKLKVNGDTPIKVSSKRWSNIYKKGIVLDWLQLFTKDGDQMRVASIIDNSYTLDWFSFLNVNWSFRLLDTYKNKMYKYPWLSYDEGNHISKWLFYNLYNIKPYEIYDVVWNVWTDGRFNYEYGKYLNFSLENKKVGTKEDLKIIQQDLKDSLNIIDKENAEYYLWMQPEELWISSNPDLPKNNNENTGNTVAKNATREEKKSCVAYYTYMRSMSSHSDGCLGEVNKDMSDTRLDYWWAISTDWDLSKFWVRDKTKYRRCWHWNNYKEGVKKSLWDKWPAFWKDRQTNYIATEAKDIDVNALCSHIVVEKSFEKTDPFSFSWMVALWWALRGILDNVWQKVKVWDSEIAVNTLSWDIGRYYTYAQACRDKRYMQTPIDSKLSYIIGYDFFFNSSNNEKVCEYAEILKKNIEKKYWGKEIDKKYRDAMANELEEKWTTWDFKNVFNDKWEIDILKLENSANKTHSNPFKDPEDVLGLRKILWFFQKDFDAWVNLVYNSLSGQRCWEWIWIKEWDYIMRLFVFIIWFVLFKWRN